MSRRPGRGRRWLIGLALPVAALGAALGAAPAAPAAVAAAGGGQATVNVVHGIPGVAVKVCVDGRTVIDDFRYREKVVGAALPAGHHGVRVVAAGKRCAAPAVLRQRFDLQAGMNYTILAAVRPSGRPALPAFANRVGPTAPGKARLTVRHTAQAPAVNLWADSVRLIGGKRFTWGDERTTVVPRGTYRVKVTLPGSRKAVIGPREITLRSGRAYQVHAVGTPDRYRLVVVRIPVGTTH